MKKIEDYIIYKDENIIAINKPHGLATQGGSGVEANIDFYLPSLKFDNIERPRLVHRIDKDTSGLLIIARNKRIADILGDAFRNRIIEKTYLALIKGAPKNNTGIINIPIIKKYKGKNEKVYKDFTNGKEAITEYKIIESCNGTSLLELYPKTGRTHQLRVHLKEIGYPIISDGKYGGAKVFLDGLSNKMHLHSSSLSIKGVFDKDLHLKAELSGHIKESLQKLGYSCKF